MSLVKGVTLSVIEEHLAVLYVLTIAPDRKKHKLEQVLEHGRACARRVMKPMYETYGTFDPPSGVNHDSEDGGYSYHSFDGSDVGKLEEAVIAFANMELHTVLSAVAFQLNEIERKAIAAATPVHGVPIMSPKEL